LPRHRSIVGTLGFFMAEIGVAWLLHPCPGKATTVGPLLLIDQGICRGKSLLISQLSSISRGRSTICRFVDLGGSSYSCASPHDDSTRNIWHQYYWIIIFIKMTNNTSRICDFTHNRGPCSEQLHLKSTYLYWIVIVVEVTCHCLGEDWWWDECLSLQWLHVCCMFGCCMLLDRWAGKINLLTVF